MKKTRSVLRGDIVAPWFFVLGVHLCGASGLLQGNAGDRAASSIGQLPEVTMYSVCKGPIEVSMVGTSYEERTISQMNHAARYQHWYLYRHQLWHKAHRPTKHY
jgi:hypothetical protein